MAFFSFFSPFLGKSDAEIIRIQEDAMREAYLEQVLANEVVDG